MGRKPNLTSLHFRHNKDPKTAIHRSVAEAGFCRNIPRGVVLRALEAEIQGDLDAGRRPSDAAMVSWIMINLRIDALALGRERFDLPAVSRQWGGSRNRWRKQYLIAQYEVARSLGQKVLLKIAYQSQAVASHHRPPGDEIFGIDGRWTGTTSVTNRIQSIADTDASEPDIGDPNRVASIKESTKESSPPWGSAGPDGAGGVLDGDGRTGESGGEQPAPTAGEAPEPPSSTKPRRRKKRKNAPKYSEEDQTVIDEIVALGVESGLYTRLDPEVGILKSVLAAFDKADLSVSDLLTCLKAMVDPQGPLHWMTKGSPNFPTPGRLKILNKYTKIPHYVAEAQQWAMDASGPAEAEKPLPPSWPATVNRLMDVVPMEVIMGGEADEIARSFPPDRRPAVRVFIAQCGAYGGIVQVIRRLGKIS